MSLFYREESRIFKNEEILSPEYLPDILPHREQQIKQLADNLLPASKGRKPQNTFLFGGPGIGKTASVKYVFREFEEYSGIKTIYLNCWDYNTALAVLSEITIRLGYLSQRRGWAKDEVVSRFVEALKKLNKGLIVCLDEVDQLVYKDQSALYDLLRINQYVNTPVGLIFISNNPHVFADLEPRIRSSLAIDEIEFKPYSLEEMKNILKERAKFGLFSLEEGVLALVSNRAVQKGGDVRIGLECLLKAGRLAEQEGADKMKVEHVKKILKEVQPVKPNIIKENVNEVEKTILDILENGEMGFTDLYKKYSQLVEKPLTIRMFREYVNHLMELNMVNMKKRKVNGKRIISKV